MIFEPPHDITLERELLGSAFISTALHDEVCRVAEDLLYIPAHRKLHTAMRRMQAAGCVLTPGALIDEVSRDMQELREGWQVAVFECFDAIQVATLDTCKHLQARLQALSDRRFLRDIGMQALDLSAQEADIKNSMATLGTALIQRRAGIDANSLQQAGRVARGIYDELGLPYSDVRCGTGFAVLDNKFGRVRRGWLNFITGRPSSGKTAFSLQQAVNLAVKEGPVLYASLEMDAEECAIRLLSVLAQAGAKYFQARQFPPDRAGYDGHTRSRKAVEILEQSGLYISGPIAGVADIRRDVQRVIAQTGKPLVAVFIDRLEELTDVKEFKGDATPAVRYCSTMLKHAAKELHVPIWCLVQMNRNAESRTDKHPILSDLQHSGALEQDGRMILAMYREKPPGTGITEPHFAEVLCLKNMSGPTGAARFLFRPASTTFEEAEP